MKIFMCCASVLLLLIPIISYSQAKPGHHLENYRDNPYATDLYVQARNAVEQGDFMGACDFLIEAINIDSLNADYYDLLAYSAGKSNDLELLNECYIQASLIFKNDHKVYYHHADAFQLLGQYDMAIEAYNKAIQLASYEQHVKDFNLYYFNRANIYLKTERFQEAIDDYTKALIIDDWHIASYLNRAIAKYKSKNLSEACQDWEKASSYGSLDAKDYLNKYCE
ncbi:tetratricopeptide repeat protein [Catalinimonas sp. 4WD22]|uniref:tetratricopeptide repeat protein n=1 Tax=Catalinimonas locisalis TaxID=3133978 RepID=UPI0031019EF3